MMEFSIIEVGDCIFTIKNSIKRFFPMNFDMGLRDFTSIVISSNYSTFMLHFDSCPAEAIMIWVSKQMNTLSNQ